MRLALVYLAVWYLTGCGASPTPAQVIDQGFWTANDQVCLHQSNTRAEFNACADQMRVDACGDGGSLADSGGCGDVRLSDGGRP